MLDLLLDGQLLFLEVGVLLREEVAKRQFVQLRRLAFQSNASLQGFDLVLLVLLLQAQIRELEASVDVLELVSQTCILALDFLLLKFL